MSENTIRITRDFDAARSVVWQAWVDPEQVARWWGPNDFHVAADSVAIDARPGGSFDLVMVHNSIGTQLPVHFEIIELVEEELLVLYMPPQAEVGLTTDTTTRVEFADSGGGTRLTLTGGPYPAEMFENANRGWNEQTDKLAAMIREWASTS